MGGAFAFSVTGRKPAGKGKCKNRPNIAQKNRANSQAEHLHRADGVVRLVLAQLPFEIQKIRQERDPKELDLCRQPPVSEAGRSEDIRHRQIGLCGGECKTVNPGLWEENPMVTETDTTPSFRNPREETLCLI